MLLFLRVDFPPLGFEKLPCRFFAFELLLLFLECETFFPDFDFFCLLLLLLLLAVLPPFFFDEFASFFFFSRIFLSASGRHYLKKKS